MLVDHRIGFVAHACGPHYMTRAEEIERLGIIIGLQLAASDTHCIEDSLMHLNDFLERLAYIIVIAVDPILDERPFQI